jgi:hypothetical protein
MSEEISSLNEEENRKGDRENGHPFVLGKMLTSISAPRHNCPAEIWFFCSHPHHSLLSVNVVLLELTGFVVF